MRKQVFFPSMLLDSSVIECKLVDLPVITNFPTSSEEEWTDYRHYGLRSADAFYIICLLLLCLGSYNTSDIKSLHLG